MLEGSSNAPFPTHGFYPPIDRIAQNVSRAARVLPRPIHVGERIFIRCKHKVNHYALSSYRLSPCVSAPIERDAYRFKSQFGGLWYNLGAAHEEHATRSQGFAETSV